MKNDNPQYLLLFSNCIPVKGISRSTIVDIQRNEIFFIDNHLYEILGECREKSWQDILEEYDESSQDVVNSYLNFLQENELCMWTDTPENFPPLDLSYDTPSIISNAIIDVKAFSDHPWAQILEELASLGCRDIQIRHYDALEAADLEILLNKLQGSYIKSIELLFPYQPYYTRKYLQQLTQKNIRIKNIILHNAPFDEIYSYDPGRGMGNIIFVKKEIDSNQHCGIVNKDYFIIHDPRTFGEFKNFNSCLNRKVGIDEYGNIKNCPTLPTIYGNIKTDKIKDAITDQFKEVWSVNKDQIDICKVCEFRYVCSDCRAFTKNDSPLGKPLKCGYDPYQMEWN